MRFTIYQESRKGGRANNQDRVAYSYSRNALLMILADGMGGHIHGEIAAQIAAQTLTDKFQREAVPRLADPFGFLQEGVLSAHQAILDYSARQHLQDSPRTTCVACLIQSDIAYWAHAGDSRLFLMRGGKVIAQTRDHSRVRVLIDEGIINEAQAAVHPDRNRIYSCLGGPHAPEIDFSRKTPLEKGDVVLLCSDGLWGAVPGKEVAAELENANLLATCPQLLDLAEQRAGKRGDNLSVVAVRWERSYLEDSPSVVSTHTMGLNEVTTRIDGFGQTPEGKSDLSEDEIEKAIAEIRAAIDKFTPSK